MRCCCFGWGTFTSCSSRTRRVAAEKVGLTLTSRDKNTENPIPMAGFPHHQLDSYLAKLIAQGLRVAICDQVEDPKKAKGLVRRDVTRVVTPGTLTDDALLDPRESNYLAAVAIDRPGKSGSDATTVGLAWVELSLGGFRATTVPRSRLQDELARIQPAECLISEDADLPRALAIGSAMMMTGSRPGNSAMSRPIRPCMRHFGVTTLEGFGFRARGRSGDSCGGRRDFLPARNAEVLAGAYRSSAAVPHRASAWRSIRPRAAVWKSLARCAKIVAKVRCWRCIDRTVTAMGSRLLADWIANPLTQRERDRAATGRSRGIVG